jgi:hypothetical protein
MQVRVTCVEIRGPRANSRIQNMYDEDDGFISMNELRYALHTNVLGRSISRGVWCVLYTR